MDRLKALSVFKAVADNGSFVAAASALELSCAAVSRMVQDLETLLGVRPFHRTTRRVALNPLGEDVLQRACGLLQSYDELASIGRLSSSVPSGVIRMAGPASFGRHYLGPALATFRTRYPQVHVELQLCEGPINVVSEEVDLCLCLPDDLRPTHIARPLASAEVGLYAAPSYLACKGEPTHPSQLGEHDCLTSTAARISAAWSFTQAGGDGQCTVNVRRTLHANHLDVLADAAIHGAGIVMLPAFMAGAAVKLGQLRPVMSDWRVKPLALHLTYNSRRNQPMAVRKLIEHLIEAQRPAGEVPASSANAEVQINRTGLPAPMRGNLALA
jgi:DNA-binding transcriptional LysR family regulator